MEISVEDVRNRAKAQVPDVYAQFASLVKSGSVVTASIVLIDILRSVTPGMIRDERLFYFFVTALLCLVPLVTYRRGAILAAAILDVRDYLFPLLMGAAEIATFLVLGGDIGSAGLATDKGFDFHEWWFSAVAAQSLCAVGLTWTRAGEVIPSRYAVELGPIVQMYGTWIRRDIFGATFFTLLAAAAAIAAHCGATPYFLPIPWTAWQVDALALVAAALGALSCLVCFIAVHQFNDIVRSV